MNTATTGDLAQSFFLRGRNSVLKQTITQLTDELATGQVADVRNALAGNYSFLSDVEQKNSLLDSYKIATSEATHFTSGMQLALGQFSTLSSELSSTLLSAGSSASATSTTDVADQARAILDAMISALNTDVAGRHLFSGNATNQPPLMNTDTLLANLRAVVGGASTPADLIAMADAWFDNPAGFSATMYQGGDEALSGFSLSADQTVDIDVRANEPGLIRALRHAAVAALSSDAAFGFDAVAQSEVLTQSGEGLLASHDQIIDLQSRVGFAEANIDTIATRNAAEYTSLALARNKLLEADPFNAATKLEEAQFQLQSLYSVTVRMSQLSLVNYL